MERALCIRCSKNLAGKGRKKCSTCARGYSRSKRTEGKFKPVWKRIDKKVCQACGFIPVVAGQMDIDHVDGNRKNNDPSNLMILCANCHRLKTYLNKDYLTKPY